MAQVVVLLAAEGVSVDRMSNNLSIFEVLEQMQPIQYPSWVAEFLVVAMLQKDDGDADDFDANLVIAVDEDEVMRQETRLGFGGLRRSRAIFRMHGVPIPHPGILRVTLEGEQVPARSYEIELREPPEGAEGE